MSHVFDHLTMARETQTIPGMAQVSEIVLPASV